MIRLILLIFLLAPSLAFGNSNILRSFVRMPIIGAYKYPGRCSSVFGDSFSIVTTQQTRGGLTHQVIDYYYTPQISRSGTLQISRFFKLKRLEVYTGMWMRLKKDSEDNYQSFAEYQNAPTKELVSQWSETFGKDPQKVESLLRDSEQTEPLRKIHIGYQVGKEHWSGIDLFDGSTPLRIFDHKGRIVKTSLANRNRSELEIRFPQLVLPERVKQEKGIETSLFFVSRNTSLPLVNRVYPQQAHLMALLLLMRLNPEFTTNHIKTYDSTELNNRFNIHAGNRMARQFESLPRYQALAPVTNQFNGRMISEALYNAEGISIYSSAAPRMLKSLQRRGWEVFENETTQGLPDDIKIIRMDAAEFIGKHLIWAPEESVEPLVTKLGQENGNYQKLRDYEIKRFQEVLERANRLNKARRSFYSEQFE